MIMEDNEESGPADSYVVVLFGATGDLSRRKLLPGLLHLVAAGLTPELRIVGTSLERMDHESFATFALKACNEFSSRHFSARHRTRKLECRLCPAQSSSGRWKIR